MADEKTQPTNVPTEEEYAARVAEFYIRLKKQLTDKNFNDVTASQAAQIGTEKTVAPYKYFLDGLKDAQEGRTTTPLRATTGQINYLHVVMKEGYKITKEDYDALQNGTLTKDRASEILDIATKDRK